MTAATATRSAMLPGALHHARNGRPVFPCAPGEKRPLTRRGYLDATTDLEVITRWWTRWPDANCGIPTGLPSTWDCLDVDNRPNGNGFGPLRRLKAAGLTAGAVRVIETPGRGLHVLFRSTGAIRNGSLPDHHLDCRGLGGYIVTTPSVVNGRPYRVIEDRPGARGGLDWDACRRLLCPPRRAWTRTAPAGASADVDQLVRWMATRPEGSRNSSMYWASCRLLEVTGGRGDLRPLINAAVTAGLPAVEAGRTAASAHRRVVGAVA